MSRKAVSKATKTHGMSQHPLYPTWHQMVSRTTNPDSHNYTWYGARGIKVYEPWRTDPKAFIGWILENLGPRPAGTTPAGLPQYTLDRIDVDGNYEPGNIQWADRVQQARNRRQVTELTRQRDELARENAELKAENEALKAGRLF
jgi:hypothetical protein